MADRRADSTREEPDSRSKEERQRDELRAINRQMADNHTPHRREMHAARDAPPRASEDWGRRFAEDRANYRAGAGRFRAAADSPMPTRPERSALSEQNTPDGRAGRQNDERGSRDYDEGEPRPRQREGMLPPRNLAMPHTGRDQWQMGQQGGPNHQVGPFYDAEHRFMIDQLTEMQRQQQQQQQQQMYDPPTYQMQQQMQQQQQNMNIHMMHSTPTHRDGYPQSGYPQRQGGPCSESTSSFAPPRRGEEEVHMTTDTTDAPQRTLADELAEANAKWQRLDDHPQLTDPHAKPPIADGDEGLPLIEGQRLFTSSTLGDDIIFVGTKGHGRWAHSKESVTVYVSNKQNRTMYTKSEVRESIAAEIKTLAGFDEHCINDDLPEAIGRAGPWKVIIAAAAAKAMIDADGVTIVAYDSRQGTRDPKDFEVEIRRPSGKPYEEPRGWRVQDAPRVRDKTKRISCFLHVPRNASGRAQDEEHAAERRLQMVANSHFHKFGGLGVGFYRPRDAESGRKESIVSMFVNHPPNMTRQDFIRAAFAEFKYIDAGLGELIKVST